MVFFYVKRLATSLIGIFTASLLLGQTKEIRPNETYNDEDFRVSDSLTHPTKKTRYELGVYFPSGYLRQNRSREDDVKIYVPIDSTIKSTYDYQIASGFLRISENNRRKMIPLDIYDDLDVLKFVSLSDRLLVFKTRYHFFLYDLKKGQATKRNTPGAYVYEGEDAISPLISALTLFDGDKFLLGCVQAYGVFCYDLSDPTRPEELRQYGTSNDNQGQYYLFLYPKETGLWDIILANSNIESSLLTRVYQNFENIRYALRNVKIKLNEENQPDVTICESGIARINLKNDSFVQLNLYTGERTRISI